MRASAKRKKLKIQKDKKKQRFWSVAESREQDARAFGGLKIA